MRATSHCGEQGLSLVVACGLLSAVVSLVAAQAVGCVGFNGGDLQARLLCGMWNLPQLGIKPMCPALAD